MSPLVQRSAEVIDAAHPLEEEVRRIEEARPGPTPIAGFLAVSALLHAAALWFPVPLIHDEVRLPAVLEPLTATVATAPQTPGTDAPRPESEIEPKAPAVTARPPARPRGEAAPAPALSSPAPARSAPSAQAPLSLPAQPPMRSGAEAPAAATVSAVEPSLSPPVPGEKAPGAAPAQTPDLSPQAALETTPPSATADYLRNPPPAYPLSARRLGQEGWVVLRVKVDPSGAPAEVHLERSSGVVSLDQAALEAVRRWTFVPARRGGEAVAAWVEVPIRFQLRDAGK